MYLQEEIDLAALVYQVHLDEERLRSQQIQDSDRYVILLVKRPSVALRYQLPSGQACFWTHLLKSCILLFLTVQEAANELSSRTGL